MPENRYQTLTNAIRTAEDLVTLRREQLALTEKLVLALKQERAKIERK